MGPAEFLRNQFGLYRLWILECALNDTGALQGAALPSDVEIRFLDRHARRDWICERASSRDWPQFRVALQHHHDLVVALQSGQNVGWAWLGYESVFLPPLGREIHLPPGVAYLYEAYVRPASRGLGIGKALVGARRERATEVGCERLLTHVLAGNQASLRALQAHGFHMSGRTEFLKALALRMWTRTPLPVVPASA